jgi:hypothetical protein
VRNAATITGEMYVERENTAKRTPISEIEDVSVLLGDGQATVSRNLAVRFANKYSRVSLGTSVSVTLSCNQDNETLEQAEAEARRLAIMFTQRYQKRLEATFDTLCEQDRGARGEEE